MKGGSWEGLSEGTLLIPDLCSQTFSSTSLPPMAGPDFAYRKTKLLPLGAWYLHFEKLGSFKPHSGLCVSNSPQANRWYSHHTQLSWSHVWGNLEERQGCRAYAEPQAKHLALNRCPSDPLDEEKAKKLFSQKHKAYSCLSGIACGFPHLLGHTCNQGHESRAGLGWAGQGWAKHGGRRGKVL